MQSRDYENNSSQQSESRRNSHARKHFEDTIELEKFIKDIRNLITRTPTFTNYYVHALYQFHHH